MTSGLDAAMAAVGDRWTLLVVDALLAGPRRFSELQEAIPRVAPNVLTARLRRLEQEGLVTAVRYSDRPPRVEYRSPRPAGAGRGVAVAGRWGAREVGGRGGGPPPPVVRDGARNPLVLSDLRRVDRAGRRRPPLGLTKAVTRRRSPAGGHRRRATSTNRPGTRRPTASTGRRSPASRLTSGGARAPTPRPWRRRPRRGTAARRPGAQSERPGSGSGHRWRGAPPRRGSRRCRRQWMTVTRSPSGPRTGSARPSAVSVTSPTPISGGARRHRPAESRRHLLGAQAHAENGEIGADRLGDPGALGLQPRELGGVVDPHGSSHDDQGTEVGGLRKRAPDRGAPHASAPRRRRGARR